MNEMYSFDELYQAGNKRWKAKLDRIRYNYFDGMDLNPSKPVFAQNVAVKKADAAESSDEETKSALAEATKKATLPDNFFDEA